MVSHRGVADGGVGGVLTPARSLYRTSPSILDVNSRADPGGQPGHGPPPKTFQGGQYYSLPPPPKPEVEFAKNYDDATIFDVI